MLFCIKVPTPPTQHTRPTLKLYAITTSYFPNEALILENFQKVKDYVESYIVVDNSESYNFSTLNDHDSIHIIKSANVGVSGGLNKGIAHAKACGADQVILFDQDSLVSDSMIPELLNTLAQSTQGCTIVAPNIVDTKSKASIHERYFDRGTQVNDRYVEVPATQMSGLLIPMTVFDKVGPFDENYFLDLADSEWCWRARNKHCKIIIDTKAVLFHEYGEGTKSILGYKFSYGAPFRSYYISRDRLNFLAESKTSLIHKARLATKFLLLFIEAFFLKQPFARLKYLFKGVVDFFAGVRGKGL